MANPSDKTEISSFAKAWREGTAAARHNLYPAIGLWLFGVALIVGYFFAPAFEEWLNRVAEFKSKTGWVFAAISTAIFGGVIPVLITWMVAGRKSQAGIGMGWGYLISNFFFWALKGIEIDVLYQLQAIMFGNDANGRTLVLKVSMDQMIYAPLIGLLNVVLFYKWRECGYSFSKFREELGIGWYRKKVLPVLISNWFVWVPACAIIYLLPLGLQLPIQNLILCFWVLILAFFTEKKTDLNGEATS